MISAQEARTVLTAEQHKEATRLRLAAAEHAAAEERLLEQWKTADFDALMMRLEERIREVSGLRMNKVRCHVGDDKRGEVLSGLAQTALVELGFAVTSSTHFVAEERNYDAPDVDAHWTHHLEVTW